MLVKLLKTGVIQSGEYRGKKFYEYGFSEEEHDAICQKHSMALERYHLECIKSAKFAATQRPPRIKEPKLNPQEVLEIQEKHLDKILKMRKKHNENYQVIVDEEEVNKETSPLIFQCPRCKKEFEKEHGLKIHLGSCDK